MTADTEKEQTAIIAKNNDNCLLCNGRVAVSSRNSCDIYKSCGSTSDRPVAQIIGQILETEVTEDTAHSDIICKKCYKLLNEADEIEVRLAEIKEEVRGHYNRTLNFLMNGDKVDTEETEDESIPTVVEKLPLSLEDGNVKETSQARSPRKRLPSRTSDEEDVEKENTIVETELIDLDEDSTAIAGDGELDDMEEEGQELHLKIKLEPGEIPSFRRRFIKRKPKVEFHHDEYEKVIEKEGADFTCLLCVGNEKIIGDIKGISAHMRTAHEVRVYICDICGQDFRKRSTLSLHLDEHVAAEEGDFQCEVCNRIFNNLRLFRVHKRMHYPQAKLWTCETCGKRYSSRNLLDEHINTHLGVRPYKCNACGKDFASKYTFKAHTKTHEVRPRPFSCQDCGKTFLSQQNLSQHERTHSGLRNYVCDQCGKAFGTARNLEVHSVVHSGFKPFICRTCGKAFARKAEIRDHERTHTGEKPYQCEFCGATFSQRSNLQSHKRATHYQDKRYKCLDCGKGFKRRRLLDYHIKAAHTGERPYKCAICEATFVYPEHFKKHRRIHTGEKPFQCEVCGKAFNSRDNRNAHRFVHSDKKPYECLVCGMGFMRKPLLYNHMQTQGHLNDTIVVNQPRLTNEDEIIQTTEADGEIEMVVADGDTETKLYIAELKDHVIIQEGDNEHLYAEKTIVVDDDGENHFVQEAVEHLIIDGQVHFADPSELANLQAVTEITTTTSEYSGHHETIEGHHAFLVPAKSHGDNEGDEKSDERGSIVAIAAPAQAIQTSDGSVHLVQIRMPSEQGSTRTWYNNVETS